MLLLIPMKTAGDSDLNQPPVPTDASRGGGADRDRVNGFSLQ